MAEWTLRRVVIDDWRPFRALRLEALERHPTAFGGDYAHSTGLTDAQWRERLERGSTGNTQATWVAESADGLIGTATLMRDEGIKTLHCATLIGVYVDAAWRGHGIMAAIIEALLEWARTSGIARVRLGVATDNLAAITVYGRKGFAVYGLERDALRVDGRRIDELLMEYVLEQPGHSTT